MLGPNNVWGHKNLVDIYCWYKKFGYKKPWIKKWSPCTLITLYIVATDHTVSCKFVSLCLLFILITLYLMIMDHPVSWGYGSPCIHWLLTNDHPVSSENGQPSIGGCQVSQVSQIRQFKHLEVGGWLGGPDG